MRSFRLFRLIGFIVCAVLILVFNAFFLHHLRWIIGGLIVLYGLLGILELVLKRAKPIYTGHGFLFNAVEILLGLATLCFIEEYSTVCIVWAVWSILRESIELQEIVERKLHSVLAFLSGSESLAVIVLSVILIVRPGEHHAMVHLYLLSAELFLTSTIPLINSHLMREKKPQKKKRTEKEETR